tara:strand:+ start:159 stop:359 length:201 start_codon:yes stop_codon:yes gene_type:complete
MLDIKTKELLLTLAKNVAFLNDKLSQLKLIINEKEMDEIFKKITEMNVIINHLVKMLALIDNEELN